MMAEERADELRRSVRPRCGSERRLRTPGVRETIAHALVKLGMLVHHNAGERAATHIHTTG
jgi:hypothetical protein